MNRPDQILESICLSLAAIKDEQAKDFLKVLAVNIMDLRAQKDCNRSVSYKQIADALNKASKEA